MGRFHRHPIGIENGLGSTRASRVTIAAPRPKFSTSSFRIRWAAFTLIELLVVVAIVAILAALLLPSLKRSRDLARQAACLSHMRQVSTALLMLADESEGWLDPSHIGTNFWENALKARYGFTGMFTLDANGKSKGCPSFQGGTWGHTAGGMGLNSALQDTLWGVYPPHSLREIANPTTTMLVSDYFSSDVYWPSGYEWTLNTYAPYTELTQRHEGRGLSMVFVDGHGEFVRNQAANSLWYQTHHHPPSPQWNGYGFHLIWGP